MRVRRRTPITILFSLLLVAQAFILAGADAPAANQVICATGRPDPGDESGRGIRVGADRGLGERRRGYE